MKSYWTIWCEGAASRLLVKKLERLLDAQAIAPETERVVLNGKKFEVVDFFLDHSCDEWSALVAEVLRLASHVTPQWTVTIGGGEVRAVWDRGHSHQTSGLSGVSQASWQVRGDQDYTRQKLTGAAGKSMW